MSEAPASPVACAVALHVFSGVHLGARIELTAGSWLLGSADECDLILNGLAPRHALLHIRSGDDGVVAVSAAPQGGRLVVDGVQVEKETPLQCGAAWYLDETCFAWNLPNAVQEAILPRHATPVAAVTETGGEAADAEEAPKREREDGTEAFGAGERQTVSMDDELLPENAGFQPVRMDGTLRPARVPLRQRLRRPLPLLCLAILLCALSFTFSTGPSRSEYPAVVSDILEKAGLTGLAVTPRWPGVEVRGAVAAASDLERLEQALQKVSFPVYMEVAVDDDMLRAVRNAMGVRGFFPVVRMERGGSEPRLKVAAFMRDALVEADAFAALEKDVPSPPFKDRRIVHEKDAVPFVLAALQNAGFGDIQPVCLPGRISLTGNLDADRETTLTHLKSGLNAHFGVPLFGEGVLDGNSPFFSTAGRGAALTPPPRAAQAKQADDARMESAPLGEVKLTGVFLAPLSFVTTENGNRLFQGSVLPNGNVLESITASKLTLRRGDKVFTYRLRGNHE